MSTYLFAYRVPKGYTPGGPDVGAAWAAWFDGLGSSVQELGNPVFSRTAVGGVSGESVLGGYSLIVADDLESAATLAKGCPVLDHGGMVEVGEITEIRTA